MLKKELECTATVIGKKKAKAEKTVEDNKASAIARATAEKNIANFQKQLDDLFEKQEAMKPKSGVPLAEAGLPQHGFGDIIKGVGSFLGKHKDTITKGLEVAGQLAPVGYNLYQGMQPAEQLNAPDFYNPYASQAMGLMANRRFNVNPLLRANQGAYSTALQNIRSASGGSRGAYLGNIGGAMMGKQAADSAAYAQKQNVDLGYMGEQAKMMAGLGSEQAQTNLLVSDLNVRNEAARKAFLGTAAGQLGQFSQASALNRGMRERDEMMMPYMQEYLKMLTGGRGSRNKFSIAAGQVGWDPSNLSINPYPKR